ncbi:MAG0920 family protein [Mycoplasma sp. Mirounga ES2805-ORL]|uniref:MAG0920 family protein n=1 Tax=Mycoplasma sp. Mirounga ES2805-ORL TaxID=754514 RepID=UPI00197C8EEB|nr:hypothetical protein [Mycoplasma sp. Mirounga ES2805-ORL]QSF13643.1 hypothetical protein JXZ90_03180 [Mycoplasma sp. Mirounga ES2805-ORL]
MIRTLNMSSIAIAIFSIISIILFIIITFASKDAYMSATYNSRKHCIKENIKVRNYLFPDLIKYLLKVTITFTIFTILNIPGTIFSLYAIFTQKYSIDFLRNVLVTSLSLLLFLIVSLIALKSLLNVKKWFNFNNSLSDENYIENKINLSTKEKQLDFKNNQYSFQLYSNKNSNIFKKLYFGVLTIEKNKLNSLTESEQQKYIYSLLITDFETTYFYKTNDKLSLDMLRDSAITFGIISKNISSKNTKKTTSRKSRK